MSDQITPDDIMEVLSNDEEIKDKKVVFTSGCKVNSEELKPYVDKILAAIGIQSAWLSDKSAFGDFSPILNNDKMIGIRHKIGVEVEYSSLIWETAEKMKNGKV